MLQYLCNDFTIHKCAIQEFLVSTRLNTAWNTESYQITTQPFHIIGVGGVRGNQ